MGAAAARPVELDGASSPNNVRKLDPENFHHHFVLKKVLRGRHACQVRLAKEVTTGRTVAVKIVSIRTEFSLGVTSIDQGKVRKARREARLLSRLGDSSFCPQVCGHFLDEAFSYTVMEHCPVTLLAALRHVKDVREPHYIKVACGLLRALEFVHSRRVVHRGVKPSNLVTDDAHELHVKLSNFDQAVVLLKDGDETTSCLSDKSDPGFMSPELLDGYPHGGATDVWSAGVTLYVLTLGDFPYRPTGRGDAQMKDAVLHGVPKPTFQTSVPASGQLSGLASALLGALLARQAEERPTATAALEWDWFKATPREDVPWPSLKPALEGAIRKGVFEAAVPSSIFMFKMDRHLKDVHAREKKVRRQSSQDSIRQRKLWSSQTSEGTASISATVSTELEAAASPSVGATEGVLPQEATEEEELLPQDDRQEAGEEQVEARLTGTEGREEGGETAVAGTEHKPEPQRKCLLAAQECLDATEERGGAAAGVDEDPRPQHRCPSRAEEREERNGGEKGGFESSDTVAVGVLDSKERGETAVAGTQHEPEHHCPCRAVEWEDRSGGEDSPTREEGLLSGCWIPPTGFWDNFSRRCLSRFWKQSPPEDVDPARRLASGESQMVVI